MGLQRHVAEVLQPDHAEGVVVVEELGNRYRHLREELGDAHEGQRGVVDGAGMHGQHDRRLVVEQHPHIAAIRRVAGQGHHSFDVRGQALPLQVVADPLVQIARTHLTNPGEAPRAARRPDPKARGASILADM